MRLTFVEGRDSENNLLCYSWDYDLKLRKDEEGNAKYATIEAVKEKRPESAIFTVDVKDYLTGEDRIEIDRLSSYLNEEGVTVRNDAAFTNALVFRALTGWSRKEEASMASLTGLAIPVYLVIVTAVQAYMNRRPSNGDYL